MCLFSPSSTGGSSMIVPLFSVCRLAPLCRIPATLASTFHIWVSCCRIAEFKMCFIFWTNEVLYFTFFVSEKCVLERTEFQKNAEFFLWWVYNLIYQTKRHGLNLNNVHFGIFGFHEPSFNTHTSLQIYNIHMFLMHVPCFFSLFLFQPTNAQIYITTPPLYIRYTHTCFDITVSSSGSFKNLCLTKLHKFLKLWLLKLWFHKIIRLKYIKYKIY
jgi:hypothetical protein